VQSHLGKKCGAKSAVGGAKNGGRGLEKNPTHKILLLKSLKV
jgi:hypothetical protein